MPGFFVRLLITALGLWLAANVLDGVRIAGPLPLFLAALMLGFVNAFVRPLVVLLTLPLTLLTLGLFLLIVNAAMLALVAAILPGFSVDGLWAALLAWAIVSVTSWIGAAFVGPKGRYEVYVGRRGP